MTTLQKSLLLSVIAALLGASPAQADPRTWRVRSGDALSVVAQRFGVTVDQLRDWNDLEGDTIFVGQDLRVQPEQAAPAGAYEVAAGDTLSGIAVRFDVTLEDLSTWNPELDPDRIQAGQRLRVGPERRRVEYRVRRGDSLSRIAARHGVAVRDLLEWNRGLRRDRVRIGRQLTIYSERPLSLSQAVGSSSHGRLTHPVRLRRHAGYLIRDPSKAWGTEETVNALVTAFDAVRREHGLARRVRVHDISDRDGGFLSGHVSHQNGRDVDISFYQSRCGGAPCAMRRIGPDQMDVARQWTLLQSFLEEGRAEAIFMDYELQAPLYRHARARGATREQLHRWFQYPRGRTFPLGVIRHYPRHRDHLHVRFGCHESDELCE